VSSLWCFSFALMENKLNLSRRAEVKLPAEDVDRFQRPNFITTNDAGMEVCENRLSCTLISLPSVPHAFR